MLDALGGTVGIPVIVTTDNRGMTPEEIADLAMDKILSVSVSAPAAIREQALNYRTLIHAVVLDALREAVIHDRVTVGNKLVQNGFPQAADLLKEI